jgi:hypothetical protein
MQKRKEREGDLPEVIPPNVETASYGPILTMQFLFPPERPFISGNHLHGHTKAGGRYLTKKGRAQKERLTREAFLAAREARWEMPDYCRLEIIGINIDADGDNLSKPICDVLERSWYFTDRRIKNRTIINIRGKGLQRIVVAVQAVNGKAFGYPKPSKRKKEPRPRINGNVL